VSGCRFNNYFGHFEQRMRCDRCQSEDATIHISFILHARTNPKELHLCQACARITHAAQPLLNPSPEPLPVAAARPVMSLPREAKEKIRSVNDKLAELDPILERFCAHRACSFLGAASELWPSRGAWAPGEIDRYLNLTTDVRFVEILSRGFYPEMPWSLYATATLRSVPGQPVQWRTLKVDVFRGLPFSGLASVLKDQLERGFSILNALTPDDVLARGEIPQGEMFALLLTSRSARSPRPFSRGGNSNPGPTPH
jgi:hypothetical protein